MCQFTYRNTHNTLYIILTIILIVILLLSGNNGILIQKGSNMCKPQYTIFRKGRFLPLEKPSRKDFDATKIQNAINASQCGDRCSAFYKEYSTTKSPCPKSLIEPLYQIFKGSSSSWDSVTTEDDTVTKDLENIKAIAQANTFLLEKILNDETYSKFCFHVIKLLFGAYKSIQGKGRGFEEDNGGGQWSHKDDNDVQGTGKDGGAHGKGGKNQDDDYEEDGDSHGKNGMIGNGKNGRGNGKAGQNGQNTQNLEDEGSDGKRFKTSQIGSIIESMFKGSSGSRNDSHDAKRNQEQTIVGEDFSGGSKDGSASGPHQNLNMSDIFSIINGLKDNGTQAIQDGNNSSMMRTLTDTLKQVLHIGAGNGNNGTGQDNNQQGLKQNQNNQGNFDVQGNLTLGQGNFEKPLGGGENMTKLLSILRDIHSNLTMQSNSSGNTSSHSPNTNSIKTALKNILDSASKGFAGTNQTGNGSLSTGKGQNNQGKSDQGKSNQGKGSMNQGKRRKRSSRGDHMDGNQNTNQQNNKTRGQNGKGSNMGPKQGKGGSGQPKKVMNNYFPFGAWNWGLPDLGLVSGKPNCALLNPNCQNKKSVLDSWYSDCVCPWVWSGKSGTCPFGNEGNSIVAKANILYLKNKPNFPGIRPPFEVFENFTSSIQNSPIDQSDIDFLISSYSEFLQAESNSSMGQLMQSYLENLSPQFKESLLTLLREIQGKGTFRNAYPIIKVFQVLG